MAAALLLVDKLLAELEGGSLGPTKIQQIDYKIERLQPKHVQETRALIIDAFQNRTEPLSKSNPPGFWDVFLDITMGKGRIHDASSIAVLNDGTRDIIIGGCLCIDLAQELPTDFMEKIAALECKGSLNAMWPLSILDEITMEFKEELKANDEFKTGVVLECCLSAVHRDYTRKGVVSALKRNMLEIGEQMGYQYVVSEATNHLSQAQNAKLGFKVKKEIFYKEWEYKKGSGHFPFAQRVEELGHEKLALMVYSI